MRCPPKTSRVRQGRNCLEVEWLDCKSCNLICGFIWGYESTGWYLLAGGKWLEELVHWGHTFEVYILSLGSELSLCFLIAKAWAASLHQPFCHEGLAHVRPRVMESVTYGLRSWNWTKINFSTSNSSCQIFWPQQQQEILTETNLTVIWLQFIGAHFQIISWIKGTGKGNNIWNMRM